MLIFQPGDSKVEAGRLVWRQIVCVSNSVMSYSCDPRTVAHQAPLSMEFSRQEILELVAISFSRGSSRPRDQTPVSCIVGRFFTVWATREGRSLISLWETGSRCSSHGHDKEETDTEDALEKMLLFYQQTVLEREERQKGLKVFRVWWFKW